jgi:hypothetical protein
MAGYFPPNNGTSPGDGRDIATNWSALNVPLQAYQGSLITFERWTTATFGFEDEKRARAEFISALSIFYIGISSEFDTFLQGAIFKKDYVKNDEVLSICLPKTYDGLQLEGMKYNQRSIYVLYKVIISWAVQYGCFKTFVEKRYMDIFDEVEEESI